MTKERETQSVPEEYDLSDGKLEIHCIQILQRIWGCSVYKRDLRLEGSVVIASNTIKTILHRSWIRCTTHGFGRKRELINYKEANLGIVYEKRKKNPHNY